MAEHRVCNAGVRGSNPLASTNSAGFEVKYHKLYGILFLASAAILLLNAASPEGFFPSGHGTGRVSEIISGFIFGFAGVMFLISWRRGESEKRKPSDSQ